MTILPTMTFTIHADKKTKNKSNVWHWQGHEAREPILAKSGSLPATTPAETATDATDANPISLADDEASTDAHPRPPRDDRPRFTCRLDGCGWLTDLLAVVEMTNFHPLTNNNKIAVKLTNRSNPGQRVDENPRALLHLIDCTTRGRSGRPLCVTMRQQEEEKQQQHHLDNL